MRRFLFSFILESRYKFSGQLDISRASSDSTANIIYFLKDSVSEREQMLTKVTTYRDGNYGTNAFYLLIWRPFCPTGTSYCYRMNSCVATEEECKNVSQSIRAIVCPTGGIYSVALGACLNETGSQVAPESALSSLLDFSSYYLYREILVDISTMTTNVLTYDYVLPTEIVLLPGDVAAIGRPDTTYSFPLANDTGNEPRIAASSIANFNFGNQGLVEEGNKNIIFQTDSLTNSGFQHQIKLYYSMPVYFSLDYTFTSHTCEEANSTLECGEIPLCRNDTLYNITTTIEDQDSTVTLSQEVLLQVSIDPVEFNFTDICKSPSPIYY